MAQVSQTRLEDDIFGESVNYKQALLMHDIHHLHHKMYTLEFGESLAAWLPSSAPLPGYAPMKMMITHRPDLFNNSRTEFCKMVREVQVVESLEEGDELIMPCVSPLATSKWVDKTDDSSFETYEVTHMSSSIEHPNAPPNSPMESKVDYQWALSIRQYFPHSPLWQVLTDKSIVQVIQEVLWMANHQSMLTQDANLTLMSTEEIDNLMDLINEMQ